MTPLALLALLTGCLTPPEETGGDDTGDSGGDNGGGGDTQETAVTVELDATAVESDQISTVLRVSWTTPEPGTSVVEWGLDEGYGYRTVDTGATTTDHEVLVAGLPTGGEVHWRVRSEVNGEVLVSPDYTHTTGPQDQALPDGSLLASTEGGYTSGFRIVPLSFNPGPVVIFDDRGVVSWWTWAERERTITDAQLANNKTDILYLIQDKNRRDDVGGLVRVGLETPEDPQFIPLSMCHHAFAELPDGRIAYLGVEIRTVEGEDVYGDTVVIVDADGGNPETIFSTWDYWTPDVDAIREDDTGFYPEGLDWTHGNSLHYDPTDDTFVASFHNVSAAVKMTSTGEIIYQLGGPTPTLTLTSGASTEFADQHNPQQIANGNVIMFDNGDFADSNAFSEAAEYEIDVAGGTYERVWNWSWTGDEIAYLMGDVTRMENGNTFTNWGASGALVEVTAAGEVVWQYEGALGSILGFSDFQTQLGVPVP